MPPNREPRKATRQANTIDKYSLLLQIIQVYPVVLGAVAVVLPVVPWLRITVALAGLVIVSTWAVLRARRLEAAAEAELEADAAPTTLPALDAEEAPAAVEGASEAAPTVHRTHERHADRWRHPSDASHPRGRGRPLYQRPVPPRTHGPISPPSTNPHRQNTDNNPETSDDPGHDFGVPPPRNGAGAGRASSRNRTGRTDGQRGPD